MKAGLKIMISGHKIMNKWTRNYEKNGQICYFLQILIDLYRIYSSI